MEQATQLEAMRWARSLAPPIVIRSSTFSRNGGEETIHDIEDQNGLRICTCHTETEAKCLGKFLTAIVASVPHLPVPEEN